MCIGQSGRYVADEPKWILTHEDPGAPRSYTLHPYGNIDMYIQPDGCLEFGETDVNGNREFVHFCPDMFDAVVRAIVMAEQ